ncbi:(Fe-S)-binding protein [Desulforhopalus sp. IMCC35007]|uniref:(Fe-S)-binding protein n=1 Tax=Desulforhopalus sp. IMCC35007 TaxID=2569543 RepID=UPI0010AE4A2F|nr:(Fe-S)-binding protein [Desulforhopalus sp. IMCC35007]TKB07039.1 Fe-S cluster protein [Desulforhopalus sp. IMCC35007]
MLIKNYTIELSRPGCNASFQSLNCIGHLDVDISEAIPLINAVLGGASITKSPPSVTFKVHGRLITVYSDKISINALSDADEAKKVLEWVKNEINDAWEKRQEITPEYEVPQKPELMKILKLLPKTNCRECGQPTCLVFSTLVTQGVKGAEDCPGLAGENKQLLVSYLSQFQFSDFS